MFIGPVFTREVVTTPRRPRLYVYRAVYAIVLFVLICTAWLVLANTQVIRNIGEMAQFGGILFHGLALLQMLLITFFAALTSAAAVSQEKDRRTLVLLLITRLTNSELVLGKLLASLLNVLVMLATALPVFMLISLLGGVSFAQVGWVFAVTALTALTAGSLGSTIALWREKTFQTLALTAMLLLPWLLLWFPLRYAGGEMFGQPLRWWADALSPLGAIESAAAPAMQGRSSGGGTWPVYAFFALDGGLLLLLNGIAIWRVRIWNPSREVRRGAAGRDAAHESIWGAEHDLAQGAARSEKAEAARESHVDAQLRSGHRAAAKSREVWDNPVLWREVCTWAYGRKVIAIRIAYLIVFASLAAAVHVAVGASASPGGHAALMPAAAWPLMPLFFVSMVIVNALAVTAVTSERDGQALDLLLATDLSPKEFVLGKLAGVLWVAKEMIVLPMLLAGYVWWSGAMSLEDLAYLVVGLAVMNVFVAMLGLHCAMIYANSRTSISVSLGAVFFLFLGVVTCIYMMISFSGSFQVQLAPFLAFILGGGVGMYVSLGIRNPSPAIFVASLCVPFATFYAIVSFLLPGHSLAVFIVMTVAYGFSTAAMLIPAIFEFDVAMGRTTGQE